MGDDPAEARAAMVAGLRAGGAVVTASVESALATVPRHRFVPAESVEQAYADTALTTKTTGDGTAISSLSQPSIVAAMLELCHLEAGHRVLEIGTGTGYNTALLATIVGADGHIVSVELEADLAAAALQRLQADHDNVEVVTGDGALGHQDAAPYDRIIVTTGAGQVTDAWIDQLADGGRIVVPVVDADGIGEVRALVKTDGRLVQHERVPCGFLPMRGRSGHPIGPAEESGEGAAPMGRVEVLMVEYDDLRSDIARRAITQTVVLVTNIVLTVALIPIYRMLAQDGSIVMLAAPMVFTVGAWIHVSQDHAIINTATYLHRRLRPAVIAALGPPPNDDGPDLATDPILGWGGHLGASRRSERLSLVPLFLWAMRAVAVIGPAVAFTVWGLATVDWAGASTAERLLAVVLVAGHLVMIAGVAVLTRSVAPGYRSITGEDARPHDG